jgi:two-component system CheB/CheR fusion protein
MSRLLNTLLDISKLESGAVKPDPTDFAVAALFEELRLEFQGVAASKGLTFKVVPCDDSVHSDRSLVEQILKNLVSNAIKYTRQGSVALRSLRQQPSLVRLEVLDTGVGIPGDQLRYIYDEFFQVGVPANSSREGYGLGLSIVQRLVALLDGKLDAHSQVGKGSQFTLTLPAGHGTVRRNPRAAAEPAPRVARAQTRVLLVEDDASVREATRMLLQSDGYHVTAVNSLGAALAHAANEPRVDLLVTDYHLRDGETGMQVIAALREALRVPLRAILITGDTSAAVNELRLDPHLRLASKPIKAEELLGMLAALLNA